MPRKSTKSSTKSKGKIMKKSEISRKTAIRRTTVPPAGKKPVTKINSAPRQITVEMIALRAYLISTSGTGGSQDDNWFRAERELRGGI